MSSQQDHPTRPGQGHVHEHLPSSRPFELDASETAAPESTTPEPAPALGPQWPATARFGRNVRTLVGLALTLALVSALAIPSVFSNDPRALLAADSFDRSNDGDWGTPDKGKPWMYPTGRGSFSLIGGKGVMAVSGRGRVQQSTLNTKARDVTVQFDVALDQLTGGSGVTVVALLRKSEAGSYHARVRIGREGRIWLSAHRVGPNDAVHRLGTPVMVQGSRYREGKELRVRAQVIKRDPSQVRLMVWPAGGTPPTRWQLVRNDHGGDIGASGRVGVRAQITRGAFRPTAVLRIDDLRVNLAQDAARLPATPPTVAKKPGTERDPAPVQDKTKPEILRLTTSEITETTAVVRWDLGEPATGFVKFGLTKSYPWETEHENRYLTSHVRKLAGSAARDQVPLRHREHRRGRQPQGLA